MDVLRQLRKAANRTQQQMASMLGITQQAYAADENDKSSPPNDVLEKIADYFNVSIDYLLGRNEKIPPAERPQADISENFIKEFGDLFSDDTFIQYARLYKLMNATQRLMILGVIIGHMEKAGIALPPML